MTDNAWSGTDWIDRGREHLSNLLAEGHAGNRQARRQASRLHRALAAAGVADLAPLPSDWQPSARTRVIQR